MRIISNKHFEGERPLFESHQLKLHNVTIGDGESEETYKTNIPALLAARNAGGQPHPLTISNGINKRAGSGGFKLKPLRDDLGPNG